MSPFQGWLDQLAATRRDAPSYYMDAPLGLFKQFLSGSRFAFACLLVATLTVEFEAET
jgi:hypothetical protein